MQLQMQMQKPLHQPLTESEGQVIIIPSQGDSIGGIAYHYKEFYPPELESIIEFDDYQKVMTDINETVKSYWPCFFTICMGYVLCPVTLGLSLCLPRICVNDAEGEIRRIVEGANADYFHPKGAQLEFKKEFFKSWFQITIPKSQMLRQI